MPIEHRIIARSLRYLQVLLNRKKDSILKGVMDWTGQSQSWTQMVGLSILVGMSKSQVELWSISKIQTMIKTLVPSGPV